MLKQHNKTHEHICFFLFEMLLGFLFCKYVSWNAVFSVMRSCIMNCCVLCFIIHCFFAPQGHRIYPQVSWRLSFGIFVFVFHWKKKRLRQLQPRSRLCPSCSWAGPAVPSNNAVFTHPLRLLRMEAMPMTMLATDSALAAFLRANSLICSPVAWSLRKSLLAHWKRPETTKQW